MPTTHPHHKRLSRKQLRQPDEFQTFFGQARDFLEENLKPVLLSAAAVLIVVAAVLAIFAYQRHRDRIAGDAFYAALNALNQRQYGEAEASFEKLASGEPGREAGKLARFYLGVSYAEQGNLDKARDALAAYVAESRNPLYRGLALANLGVVYERMGKLKEAQETYAQAAGVPGPEQERAELGAARTMARRGDRSGAIKAYQQFLNAHPFAPERETVIESLAELGVSAASNGASAAAAPR